MKTIEQIEKCSCLDDNSLSKALCKVHKKPLPIEVIDQELRAAIIAAVMRAKKSDAMYGIERYRIELCDVLVAINESGGTCLFRQDGLMSYAVHDVKSDKDIYTECEWNLSKSYEDQSEETKRFIHSVICKK